MILVCDRGHDTAQVRNRSYYPLRAYLIIILCRFHVATSAIKGQNWRTVHSIRELQWGWIIHFVCTRLKPENRQTILLRGVGPPRIDRLSYLEV